MSHLYGGMASTLVPRCSRAGTALPVAQESPVLRAVFLSPIPNTGIPQFFQDRDGDSNFPVSDRGHVTAFPLLRPGYARQRNNSNAHNTLQPYAHDAGSIRGRCCRSQTRGARGRRMKFLRRHRKFCGVVMIRKPLVSQHFLAFAVMISG
jgi:hypothetical protein